jgi:kynurenine formamidase
MRMRLTTTAISACMLVGSCATNEQNSSPNFTPVKVIDLGTLITEDVAQSVAGTAFLEANRINRLNVFEVIPWTVKLGEGEVSGSNSFYTLASHGGPHVDAPSHTGFGPAIDAYSVESFSGPLKVFDVRKFPKGRSISQQTFTNIDPGDVVLVYTAYTPPSNDVDYPETITLTLEAAEYLAQLPIRAYATDAYSVANLQDQSPVGSDDPAVQAIPIHHAFLSKGIPVFEQLFNVGETLKHDRMFFSGVPLKIQNGDGMIVRPVVFVY